VGFAAELFDSVEAAGDVAVLSVELDLDLDAPSEEDASDAADLEESPEPSLLAGA